jgi:hypothetical protein
VSKKELLNLQEDIKGVRSLLETVARSAEKEVIHKVNEILIKMTSIPDGSMRNEEYNSCWMEAKKGRSNADRNYYECYQIPVINNRYELLENIDDHENVYVNREYQRNYGKVTIGKKKTRRNGSRVINMGNSQARGMANELQYILGKDFETLGIVKPGSNIKEITNTLNPTVSSLTKKDVCIVWGGTRDVAINESENGLRLMKDFVARQNHTNLVVITVPHRHDLQESSCVNGAVNIFNRKLMKYSKAFENHLVKWKSVGNCTQTMGYM